MKTKRFPTPFDLIIAGWRRRYGGHGYRMMDFNCLGLVTVLGLLIPAFHEKVAWWPAYSLVHGIIVLACLEVIRINARRPAMKLFIWLRTFYPLLILSYAWWEVGRLVPQMYGDLWATEVLIYLDRLLFGVHPTLWMQKFYAPWLDEIVNGFYSIYYFYLPVLPLYLFLRGRPRQTVAVFSIVTLAYSINFLLFYALPAMGPQWVTWLEGMRTRQPGGSYMASFTRMIQSNGGNIGGAFPSSHISGATVWALAIWRYDRKVGGLLFLLLPGIAIATVYLGYHHALDPIVGLLLGIVAFKWALKLLIMRGEDPGAVRGPVKKPRRSATAKRRTGSAWRLSPSLKHSTLRRMNQE